MGMMNGKGMSMMDAKSKALAELMAHLDSRDGRDLGDAMKPKGDGLEITKIEKLGDGKGEPDGDESPGVTADSAGAGADDDQGGDGSKPQMSDEEMQELIEAIQSKLGA